MSDLKSVSEANYTVTPHLVVRDDGGDDSAERQEWPQDSAPPDRDAEDEEQRGEIEEVAMDVLQDEREPGFPAVAGTLVPHRAGRRGPEERAVVRAAVVVAGDAEEAGKRQDEQCRRKRQPAGPPRRLGPKPGVRRVAGTTA